MSKKLSNKQFGFMMFNYIVGFGFISTIGSIINLGKWGLISFLGTSLIALGVLIVFSRMAEKYPKKEGSSFGYAYSVHGRKFAFFQGWNQYIQGPVLAASAPLFLQAILDETAPEYSMIWKILSISIFLVFVVISTLNITSAFKWISWFASIKWLIIFMAFILIIFESAKNNYFPQTFMSSEGVTIASVTGTMLTFVYAFGGIEGISSLTNDSKIKNIRKTYFTVFIIIIMSYLVFYIILMGAAKPQSNSSQILRSVFNSSLSIFGVVVYFIGVTFNKSSAIVGNSAVSSRTLAPLAKENYLPKILAKKNKEGTYYVSIYVSAAISILSMILFELIPEFIHMEDSFISVINVGAIAFLVQYLMTTITFLTLSYRKEIKSLLWEKIIIGIMISLISFILLTQIVPPILGKSYSTENLIIDIAYPSWMIIGYIAWYLTSKFKKRKTLK